MKNKNVNLKIVLLMLVAAFGVSFTGNAQLFLGGSLKSGSSASAASTGGTTYDGPSTRYFEIGPKVGYYLSDKWAIGGSVAFRIDVENTNATVNEKTTQTIWMIAPFVRYSFVEFGKFALMGEGVVGIAGAKNKITTGSTTTNGNPTLLFSLDIHPILAYNISDHFALEISPKFFNFGVNAAVTKHDSTDSKDISSSAKFNLDTDDLVGSLGSIYIGALYKF
ncbi:MAG: hypothetical protein LBN37_02255 [Bacteroidales bacterium]|jgi:hypothetical protein|nr:hypothetical protein [Bacteroidales bacterium]